VKQPLTGCTCVLGHPDHGEDCACTTTIMDCAVHGGSEAGRAERAIAERWRRAMTDRAELLALMADSCMENGGRLPPLPPGCTGFRASVWPQYPDQPCEVHFSATWPDVTLTCKRSLAGYSLLGGLHRVP
jgi:hypothetical protein